MRLQSVIGKTKETAALTAACIDPIETLFKSMFMEDHEIQNC